MKIEDLKVGDHVIDRWYPEWGVGLVTKVLKTVVHIDFTIRGKEVYDRSHVQNFLENDDDADHFKEVRRDAAASLR
jgi:hypothetical protein